MARTPRRVADAIEEAERLLGFTDGMVDDGGSAERAHMMMLGAYHIVEYLMFRSHSYRGFCYVGRQPARGDNDGDEAAPRPVVMRDDPEFREWRRRYFRYT